MKKTSIAPVAAGFFFSVLAPACGGGTGSKELATEAIISEVEDQSPPPDAHDLIADEISAVDAQDPIPDPQPDPVPDPATDPEPGPDPAPDPTPDLPPDAPGDLPQEVVQPTGPFSDLCKVGCETDSDCAGKKHRCLTFEGSGQKFCAMPCATGNPKCPDGFSCALVGAESLCTPWTGDCQVAFKGVDCNGGDLAGLCKNEDPICTSTDARPGYCTRPCMTNGDCPAAFHHCLGEAGGPKLCRALWESGPEGCGRGIPDEEGLGGACLADTDCGAGGKCLEPPEPPPPVKYCNAKGTACETNADCGKDGAGAIIPCLAAPSVMPPARFCTRACKVDQDCGKGHLCSTVGGSAEKWCLPPPCRCLSDENGMYRKVLAAVGLHPCNAMFPRSFLKLWMPSLAHDPWRVSRFHELHDYPPETLPGATKDVAALDAETGLLRVGAAIERGALLMDRPLYTDMPEPQKSPDLATAVAGFIAAAGGTSDQVAKTLEPVPAALAAKLVPVVDAMTGVVVARAEISASLGDKALDGLLFDYTHGFVVVPKSMVGLSPKNKYVKAALTGKFDFARLYTAAARLAGAVAGAGLKPDVAYGAFTVRVETPAGAIVLRGNGDDVYDPAKPDAAGPIALIVDTGGNDQYLVAAGANTAVSNPVSLLLDLAGDDIYGYVPKDDPPDPLLLPADEDGRYTPAEGPDKDNGPFSLSDRFRQGSGRFGVGMLFDLGSGKDEYRSLRLSQGCGVLGVGVLYDGGGKDLYQAEAASQGAGIFGIGVLIDEGGDDEYSGFHCMQGFAYASGFGLLYDVAGTDKYTAILGDKTLGGYPLYYNPQNPGKSNSSMSQGFGFGRRADMTDFVFMSGGFGILRDVSGNDSYSCDIFGQGGGYWFGSGILADGGGDDSYKGRWYVQGAGAHFALGILIDDLGNDVHNEGLPLLNASLGLGHDFSLGVLADLAGDDVYFSPSLGTGAGNDNGIGIFLDVAGKDSYSATATNTYGWASNSDFGPDSARNLFIGLGVMLDTGGEDSYYRPDFAGVEVKDSSLWTMTPADPNQTPLEKGGGMDGEGIAGL